MKFVKNNTINIILFFSILFLSCEVFYPYEDDCGVIDGDNSSCVKGCMDIDACNYKSDAVIEDESCLYIDCSGECGGNAVEDCIGECNGTAPADCAGGCYGSCQNILENSGDYVCGGDTNNSNNCVFSLTNDEGDSIQLSYTWQRHGTSDNWVRMHFNVTNTGNTTIYSIPLAFTAHCITGDTEYHGYGITGLNLEPGATQSISSGDYALYFLGFCNNTMTKLELLERSYSWTIGF